MLIARIEVDARDEANREGSDNEVLTMMKKTPTLHPWELNSSAERIRHILNLAQAATAKGRDKID